MSKLTETQQVQLAKVLDFVERWNKQDKDVDVAQAARDLEELLTTKEEDNG